MMHSRLARRSLLLLGVATLLLVGCGDRYDATVTGTVTLNSTPVPRGAVSFIPQGAGAPAYGMIEPDGKYTLHTGRGEGLSSGTYIATVAASEISATTGKGGGPPPMGKSIVPEWYRDPAASGLTYTVEPGDNEVNIDLNNTPPPGWSPPRGQR